MGRFTWVACLYDSMVGSQQIHEFAVSQTTESFLLNSRNLSD